MDHVCFSSAPHIRWIALVRDCQVHFRDSWLETALFCSGVERGNESFVVFAICFCSRSVVDRDGAGEHLRRKRATQ